MAKNDVVLLDSLLEQLATDPSDLGSTFELFVLDQILKNYDLTQEEVDAGWTDGTADGGIDGFYVFVNGRLVTDPKDFPWPRAAVDIQVFLLTCKHHATFQQAPLDSMLATIQELFDLSRNTADLSTKYSDDIRRCRETFIAVFRHLSLTRPALTFNLIYASRGDTALLGNSIVQRANQLTTLLRGYFSACTATFRALGASELVELHRHVKSFALDLPVQECLTSGEEGYVVLTRLQDYGAFVSDDQGELRRYLFDSNVRAYLGENLVNADILQTLRDPAGPNFWWLNNGVTILATDASLVGKTLKLKDIQIVNGLQTTECVHRHFATQQGTIAPDDRTILVKVIVSQEESVRDQVIRATNNQSLVDPAALHATDRIQRDIEEILLRHDWYYERRTNYYKNEGRPDGRIVAPLTLASGAVALLMKNPVRSSKLKQKHLRSDEANQAVYSPAYPLDAWPTVVALIRAAESEIARGKSTRRLLGSNRLAGWRGPLAYFVAVRLLGTCSFQARDLASLDPARISESHVKDCWSAMRDAFKGLHFTKCTDAHMTRMLPVLANVWRVAGHPDDGRRELPLAPPNAVDKRQTNPTSAELPEDFVVTVGSRLTPQPWKRRIHVDIARELGANPGDVSRAIKALIARGLWLEQRDGVVFDASGNEVARDESRAGSARDA